MLTRILDTLRKCEGTLDLRQLGRELDVEESALRGMLSYLVRKGYLKEEGCGSRQNCEGCGRCCFSPSRHHFSDGGGRPVGYALTGKARNCGRKP